MRRKAWLLASMASVVWLSSQAGEKPASTEYVVLNTVGTYWRLFTYWKTPSLITEAGQRGPLLENKTKRNPDPKPVLVLRTKTPPAGWMQPEFDDSAWVRAHGPFGVRWWYGSDLWTPGNPAELGAICLRGKFHCTVPKHLKDLKLSLEYHGGVVVTLNGQEVARGHLPDGEVAPDAEAEPYPAEAYVRPDGKLLHFNDAKGFAERFAKRVRRLSDVALPIAALRSGVNVLAIAVHRAPVREMLLTRRYAERSWRGDPPPWPHARLLSVKVTAFPERHPVRANTGPPEHPKPWNCLTVRRITPADFGDPNESLRPIWIPAARNGAFCGQVVVAASRAMEKFGARATDLKGPHGVIPRSAIEIFYPVADGEPPQRRTPRPFDTLSPTSPGTVAANKEWGTATQPVWIKVRVPRDARPGDYTGTLAVGYTQRNPDRHRPPGMDDQDWELWQRLVAVVRAPIRLTVHDWALPDPRDYRTFADLIESPETVALQYKVPLWSDEHFELMGRSLALLGEIGNKTTYLRLLCKTHFGNTQTIVRFVKQPDGTYRRDYRLLDRYIGLLVEKQGKPTVVVLYVWERYTSKGKPPLVSELDPATGRVREVETPKYGTPQAKAFWAPVFAEIRERMAKRGLADALMLGCVGDFDPLTKEAAEFFREVAPGLPWVSQGHGLPRQLHGVPVGYAAHVWGVQSPQEPLKGRKHGWQRDRLVAQFARDMFNRAPLPEYRQLGEWNLAGGQRGFGRIGGDFWDVLDPGTKTRGRHSAGGMLTHRFFEEGKWGQLVVRTCMLSPGKDGAIPTVRFENLREGVQACEARIFIEKALADPALRAKLGDGLAGKCQQILDERTRILANRNRKETWYFAGGFLERTHTLYAAAAEVARRLGAK